MNQSKEPKQREVPTSRSHRKHRKHRSPWKRFKHWKHWPWKRRKSSKPWKTSALPPGWQDRKKRGLWKYWPWKDEKKPWKTSALPPGWDQEVQKEKRRARVFRKIMIGVAGVVIVGAIYMLVLVVTQQKKDDEAIVLVEEPTGVRSTLPTAVAVRPERKEVKPKRVDPPRGNPIAVPPEPKRTAPLPPDFAKGVINNDLKTLESEQEKNLFSLLSHYAQDLTGDQIGISALQNAFRGLLGEDPAASLDLLEAVELGDRIENAVSGVVLSRLSRKEEAVAAFARADNTVQPAPFYFEYALHLLRNRDLDGAYAELQVAVHKAPETLLFQRAAARVGFELRKWSEVIEYVDEGIRPASTPSANISLLAAFAETQLGKRAEAEARSRKIIELHPDSAAAKLFLALLLDTGR